MYISWENLLFCSYLGHAKISVTYAWKQSIGMEAGQQGLFPSRFNIVLNKLEYVFIYVFSTWCSSTL